MQTARPTASSSIATRPRQALRRAWTSRPGSDSAASDTLHDGLVGRPTPLLAVPERRRGARVHRRPHARALAVLHHDARLPHATISRMADVTGDQGRPAQTIAVRKDLRVPMRDGVSLAADAYSRHRGPAAAGAGRAEPVRQGTAGAGADDAAAAAPEPDVGRLHRGGRHRPHRRRRTTSTSSATCAARAARRASTSATTTPAASPSARTPTTSSSGSPRSRGATATSA